MIDAIVVPQGAEYKSVHRAIYKSNNVSLPIISIPMGFDFSEAEATIAKIQSLNIKQLVMVGLCGSLSPKYSPGDVVIYQSCFDTRQQITLATDTQLTTAIKEKLPNSALVTGVMCDRVISLASEKQQLYRTYQTDVVDMEGFSYLQLFQTHNIPCAMIRVVSDDSKQDIPDVSKAIGDRGELKILPLTITMLNQPLAAIQLIRGSLTGLKILENTVSKLFS